MSNGEREGGMEGEMAEEGGRRKKRKGGRGGGGGGRKRRSSLVCGISYKGVDKGGRVDWSALTNIKLIEFETCITLQVSE